MHPESSNSQIYYMDLGYNIYKKEIITNDWFEFEVHLKQSIKVKRGQVIVFIMRTGEGFTLFPVFYHYF